MTRLAAACILAAALASCADGPDLEPPVMPPEQAGPAELRRALASIEDREDPEGLQTRALLCERLRALDLPDGDELLVRGDAANLAILCRPASMELKRAAAGRLTRSFRERASRPELSRLQYPGALGVPLRRMVHLLAAAAYAEYGAAGMLGETLEKAVEAAGEVAAQANLTEEARAHFRGEARELLRKAAAARKDPPADPGSEARKFCEFSVPDHLDEGTRQADFGTRDKADRSKTVQVVTWYLRALLHFAVVRETSRETTPAEEAALGRQDLVLRSLSDLLTEKR
jgi:hypothetical protein